MPKIYDTAIIGAGPAGLTAAIYASRSMMSTLVLEKLGAGGQIAITDIVENYPGFPDGINGFELSQKMEEQARKFGSEFEFAEISGIKSVSDGIFQIESDGTVFEAKTVIIATGANPRKLGIKGEEQYIGRGVSFCATCDAAFYKEKTVAVVGGGDSAMDEALFLTKFVKKIYLIHRRDELRASKILQKRAFDNPKIEFIWSTVVEEVIGDEKVRQLRLKNVKDNSESLLTVDGMFLYVGFNPSTSIFTQINKDQEGYVITDESMRTNIPGIFAAGDCRQKPMRQIATAISDGSLAAHTAEKFLAEKSG